MPVKVHATHMLVRHLDIKPEFTVEASTLEELLEKLDREHRGFRDSICDESGKIRIYVNVFVNEENLTHESDALSTRLRDGDEVYILASVAGGSS